MTETMVEELKALAHPLRLRILQVLSEGERNVGEIEDAAQIGQPALSQQLGVLRKAGLVETRKEAKLVYYSLGDEPLGELAKLIGRLAPGSERPTSTERTPSPGVANFARLS
ncbi:MAG: metalloregulator ArsR/SmtB family transcription factor [Erythrobacter sp.]